MFIVKQSIQREQLVAKPEFFAVPVELDPAVQDAIVKVQANGVAVGEYLQAVRALLSQRNDADLTTIGVPECLRDDVVTPEVPSESQPKKKATARTSRKKSRTSSKKTEPKASATSQPKDE